MNYFRPAKDGEVSGKTEGSISQTAADICRKAIQNPGSMTVKNLARKIGSTLVPDGAWYVDFRFTTEKE